VTAGSRYRRSKIQKNDAAMRLSKEEGGRKGEWAQISAVGLPVLGGLCRSSLMRKITTVVAQGSWCSGGEKLETSVWDSCWHVCSPTPCILPHYIGAIT